MNKILGLPLIDCQIDAFECAPMSLVSEKTWTNVLFEDHFPGSGWSLYNPLLKDTTWGHLL
jgi:hypothetical protein